MHKSSSHKASMSKNKTNSLKKTEVTSRKEEENMTESENEVYEPISDKS